MLSASMSRAANWTWRFPRSSVASDALPSANRLKRNNPLPGKRRKRASAAREIRSFRPVAESLLQNFDREVKDDEAEDKLQRSRTCAPIEKFAIKPEMNFRNSKGKRLGVAQDFLRQLRFNFSFKRLADFRRDAERDFLPGDGAIPRLRRQR